MISPAEIAEDAEVFLLRLLFISWFGVCPGMMQNLFIQPKFVYAKTSLAELVS